MRSGGGQAVLAFDSPLKFWSYRAVPMLQIDCNKLARVPAPFHSPNGTGGTFGTAKDWGKVGKCGVRGPREDPTILNRYCPEAGVMAAQMALDTRSIKTYAIQEIRTKVHVQKIPDRIDLAPHGAWIWGDGS